MPGNDGGQVGAGGGAVPAASELLDPRKLSMSAIFL
jgi:hypothetical protein